MTEVSPQSARSAEPDDIHWGAAYLRQDIQDLRQVLRQDVHEVRQDLRHQIGLVHSRIDETNKRVDSLLRGSLLRWWRRPASSSP